MAGRIKTGQFDDVLKVLREHVNMVGPLVYNFNQVPQANADVAVDANLDWEMQGTNAASLTSCVHSAGGGVKMLTAGADDDQVLVVPHADTQQSVLNDVNWNTKDQPYMGVVLETDTSVASILVEVGFVLTAAMDETTDANQAKFRFDTDDNDSNWTLNESIGGTDTETDSGVAVSASTQYELVVYIDADRKPHYLIDGKEVRVGSALTDDIDLVPMFGIQALTGAAKTVYVRKAVVGKLEYNN